MKRLLALTLAVALPLLACQARLAAAPTSPDSAGSVRFFRVANSAFDVVTRDPSLAAQRWMQQHYSRMLTYSPYFDSRLRWFPNAWVYKDLYAIYLGSALAQQHPEWILRDARGNALYIPFGCAGGSCPQYAGDVGSPAFRARWISDAGGLLAKGYLGLFVDDVNLLLSRVSDGSGQAVPPIDPRTGQQMTEADWQRYVADFTQAIAAAFPNAELVHNALWFAGHDAPDVARELESASVINLERGVNDPGIRGGAGPYGFDTLLSHIDWLHASGKGVVFDAGAQNEPQREYGLAAYFLVSTGGDWLGNDRGGRPGDWWKGYNVSLGDPLGPRYAWSGVLRRDFQLGVALVNPPDAAPRTVALQAGYVDLNGRPSASLTLAAAAGAVLLKAEPNAG
ncbi:MAG TPA: putative glycoside hydrolase [Candidatus Binatus sp.]|nr:putative glycoside hydrolase [Candidatus Binatus sp.]